MELVLFGRLVLQAKKPPYSLFEFTMPYGMDIYKLFGEITMKKTEIGGPIDFDGFPEFQAKWVEQLQCYLESGKFDWHASENHECLETYAEGYRHTELTGHFTITIKFTPKESK